MFKEEARQLPVVGRYDVAVAGGGVAGIAAALAAARGGAKTLLIEKTYMLGGLGTAGLVTIYLPLCDGNGRQLSFGIAEELLRLSISNGYEDGYPKAWLEGGTVEERTKQRFRVRYNAQMFAISAEKLLVSEGVEILYGTSVCAAPVKDGAVTHLIIESKSGREAVEVGSVIDCTGDADVCKLSGEDVAEYGKGNILAAWYYLFADGKFDLKMLGFADSPGSTFIGNERYGGLDARELSRMMISSHAATFNDFIKGGGISERRALATIATVPQVRMTRRLSGCYTMDESRSHKRFEDSVGAFGDWRKAGPAFELPFSALHGKKVKNLAAAGRCISVTDALWEVTRVIPVCAVSGEAVGTAAAMFGSFSDVNVAALQKKLISNGVNIRV